MKRHIPGRPSIYLWATTVALLAAHVHYHFGGRGFHQW